MEGDREQLSGRARVLVELLFEVLGAAAGAFELTLMAENGRLRRYRLTEVGGADALEQRPEQVAHRRSDE